MRTIYPVGTTLYKPDKCSNGYTLLWRGSETRLIDMNGRTVNEWTAVTGEDGAGRFLKSSGHVHRVRLLEDGHILVQRGGMMA